MRVTLGSVEFLRPLGVVNASFALLKEARRGRGLSVLTGEPVSCTVTVIKYKQ